MMSDRDHHHEQQMRIIQRTMADGTAAMATPGSMTPKLEDTDVFRGPNDLELKGRRASNEARSAALKDRIENLKSCIDERYRATRGMGNDSLFERPGATTRRMTRSETNAERSRATESAMARLVTRANIEARDDEQRRLRPYDSSSAYVMSLEDYDDIFSTKSTEGSFHAGERMKRVSSFEDDRIKFESALPSYEPDDDRDDDGRRNPIPDGRTREWLESKDSAMTSPTKNEKSNAALLKSPRRNGSYKFLSAADESFKARLAAEEAVILPRARRALKPMRPWTPSPENESPSESQSKSPSERSFSRTSSMLSLTSMCEPRAMSTSAFSPVGRS